jgi:hypothetical protein
MNWGSPGRPTGYMLPLGYCPTRALSVMKNFQKAKHTLMKSVELEGYFFLLAVSLYWTSTVILVGSDGSAYWRWAHFQWQHTLHSLSSFRFQNTVQVTVAGVMATWCFDKKAASGCCSSAVWGFLYRSLTFSFCSISFGSYFQGLITAIRVVVHDARSHCDNNDWNVWRKS